MDYKELSEHVDEMGRTTMVVCRDKWTKATAAHVVRAFGGTLKVLLLLLPCSQAVGVALAKTSFP